jgi:hypothetical protein
MSFSLANAHTRATVLSAVWDESEHQLVASVLSASDNQSLLALKAELEKNTTSQLTLTLVKRNVALTGARRGYARVQTPHDKFHSHGGTLAVQHWKSLDPREVLPPPRKDGETSPPLTFYVVARAGDCLTTLFAQRLQLALNLPIQLAWAETLLTLGQEVDLVQPLATARHPHLPAAAQPFVAGLRVFKDETRWHTEVVAPALARGQITF